MENDTTKKGILIIVIWSIKAFESHTKDISRSKYHIEKQALNNAVISLNGLWFHISIINPWYVDTEYNQLKEVNKLDKIDILKIVNVIIDNYCSWVLIWNLALEKIYNEDIS